MIIVNDLPSSIPIRDERNAINELMVHNSTLILA